MVLTHEVFSRGPEGIAFVEGVAKECSQLVALLHFGAGKYEIGRIGGVPTIDSVHKSCRKRQQKLLLRTYSLKNKEFSHTFVHLVWRTCICVRMNGIRCELIEDCLSQNHERASSESVANGGMKDDRAKPGGKGNHGCVGCFVINMGWLPRCKIMTSDCCVCCKWKCCL